MPNDGISSWPMDTCPCPADGACKPAIGFTAHKKVSSRCGDKWTSAEGIGVSTVSQAVADALAEQSAISQLQKLSPCPDGGTNPTNEGKGFTCFFEDSRTCGDETFTVTGIGTSSVSQDDACAKAVVSAHDFLDVFCPTEPLGLVCPDGAAMIGVEYSSVVSANGGVSPYVFTLESGELPSGLTLNPSGAITGTPDVEQTTVFLIRITDAVGHTLVQDTCQIIVGPCELFNKTNPPFNRITFRARHIFNDGAGNYVGEYDDSVPPVYLGFDEKWIFDLVDYSSFLKSGAETERQLAELMGENEFAIAVDGCVPNALRIITKRSGDFFETSADVNLLGPPLSSSNSQTRQIKFTSVGHGVQTYNITPVFILRILLSGGAYNADSVLSGLTYNWMVDWVQNFSGIDNAFVDHVDLPPASQPGAGNPFDQDAPQPLNSQTLEEMIGNFSSLPSGGDPTGGIVFSVKVETYVPPPAVP